MTVTGSAFVPEAHMFGFEVWPDPMPVATYPMLVPDHTGPIMAPDYDTARAIAEQNLTPGQALGACQHHRGRCTPAHPGHN